MQGPGPPFLLPNALPAASPGPRRSGETKCRKRTKHGVYTADITYEDLQAKFTMPSQKAAEALGVGLTIFKRICRRFGLKKWPYRQLLKQQREERRSRGRGARHHDYSDSSDTEEEEAGSDSDSDSRGDRRTSSKRQKVDKGKPAAAPSSPSEPAAPPAQLLAQQASWPDRQQQQQQPAQVQHRPAAVTTGWQGAGFARFQQPPALMSPAALPAVLSGASPSAGGAPQAAQQPVKSEQLPFLQQSTAGLPSAGNSFRSLIEMLQRDVEQQAQQAQQADTHAQVQQALLEARREQLLQMYSGGAGPGGALPTVGEGPGEGQGSGSQQSQQMVHRPKPVMPAVSAASGMAQSNSTADLLIPLGPLAGMSGGPELFPSGLLDRLLPGYSLGLSNTPKSHTLSWQAQQAQRNPSPAPLVGPAAAGPASVAAQAAQLQQALGAVGSDSTTLFPSASLLMSAAAGMALPSPGAPGSGGGSGSSDAPPNSSGSWWALDSPMATLLSPASDQQARQLEEQSLALSQLIGSLKAEISSIEAQQQRLVQQQQAHKRDRERLLQEQLAALKAEEEVRERERQRQAVLATAAAATQLRRLQAEQQRLLLQHHTSSAAGVGATARPESLALVQLLAGLQKEINKVEAQLEAAQAAQAAQQEAAAPAQPPLSQLLFPPSTSQLLVGSLGSLELPTASSLMLSQLLRELRPEPGWAEAPPQKRQAQQQRPPQPPQQQRQQPPQQERQRPASAPPEAPAAGAQQRASPPLQASGERRGERLAATAEAAPPRAASAGPSGQPAGQADTKPAASSRPLSAPPAQNPNAAEGGDGGGGGGGGGGGAQPPQQLKTDAAALADVAQEAVLPESETAQLRELMQQQLVKRLHPTTLPSALRIPVAAGRSGALGEAAAAAGLLGSGRLGSVGPSGLSPITPAEPEEAALASAAGLPAALPADADGAEAGTASFLARMSAVHSLQQRMAERNQQQRQQALLVAQARIGQLQQQLAADRQLAAAKLAAQHALQQQRAQQQGAASTAEEGEEGQPQEVPTSPAASAERQQQQVGLKPGPALSGSPAPLGRSKSAGGQPAVRPSQSASDGPFFEASLRLPPRSQASSGDGGAAAAGDAGAEPAAAAAAQELNRLAVRSMDP